MTELAERFTTKIRERVSVRTRTFGKRSTSQTTFGPGAQSGAPLTFAPNFSNKKGSVSPMGKYPGAIKKGQQSIEEEKKVEPEDLRPFKMLSPD